jgi:hypothetical protein
MADELLVYGWQFCRLADHAISDPKGCGLFAWMGGQRWPAEIDYCLLTISIGSEQLAVLNLFGGIAQLVEHELCKLGVTGSNPVASTQFRNFGFGFWGLRHGVVAAGRER